MKVLIIGCKGFIGSHAFKTFKAKHDTWGCDIATDYETKNYIQTGAGNVGYQEIFSNNTFDVCINCSGAASVPDSIKNPFKDYELNTVNVFKMLDAIRRFNNECKFINLSSAGVYGNPVKLPIKENAGLIPVSPYGMHKKQAEETCSFFYNYWGIKTCSLRIFSAYGAGLTKQLFWDLYQKIKASNSIALFGTGKESRDFIYVDDIIQSLLLVIQNADFKGECINIGNGEQWTVYELTKMFFKLLEWNGKVGFTNENRAGDPLKWEADISVLKSIGYKQQVSMKEGLSKYIQWLKERE